MKSLITTRYTEFFDDDFPGMPESIVPDYYYFEKQKDFASHMYFLERIAYATALYRTVDFKKTAIEYEKFNKFNDWPFLVKMSGIRYFLMTLHYFIFADIKDKTLGLLLTRHQCNRL